MDEPHEKKRLPAYCHLLTFVTFLNFCPKSSLFRVFELSCFRDRFSSSIRGKQNHPEDHESTKKCIHRWRPKNKPARIARRFKLADGVTRSQFIPRCQRSIVVGRFWFRKPRRAEDVNPRIHLKILLTTFLKQLSNRFGSVLTDPIAPALERTTKKYKITCR